MSGLKDIFQVLTGGDFHSIAGDFFKDGREGRDCSLPVWRMRDVTAEGGAISKYVDKEDFSRVREIIDGDQELDWAQNTEHCLGTLQL